MNIPITDIEPMEGGVSEDEVTKLAESIQEQGLLHPLIVRIANINGVVKYKLVAGQVRYFALKKLGWEQVPCDARDMTDMQVLEITLHENLKRKNLDWYEEAELTTKLHELRQQQHGGQQKQGRPKAGEKVWGVRDTAKELEKALGPVSEDLLLVKMVKQDPTLRNIKDRNTAVRMARVKAQRMGKEEEEGLPSRITNVEPNQVFLGSSAEILKMFPDNTFDGCITDPPWLKFHNEKLTKDDETLPVFKELYRVLRYNSLLYMFVGLDDVEMYRKELPKVGFRVASTPCLWHKLNHFSRRAGHQWEHMRDFEFILYAAKGDPVLTESVSPSSVFTFPNVPTRSLVHPNEKPVELIERIIDLCSNEHAFFIEPFGGSFSHVEALIKKNRRYIAIERDKTFYQNGLKRIANIGKEKK